jgi:hypothetical protein
VVQVFFRELLRVLGDGVNFYVTYNLKTL